MAMTWVWCGMVLAAVLCGAWTGRSGQVAAAALEGAAAGVELSISLAGVLCLWTGVMKVMERAGLARKLARLLQPVLGRLYPDYRRDRKVMDCIASNVSANLLGLGNAATPLGIRAAEAMAGGRDWADDGMCMLIVCNTASIQLIPATVAAVRSGLGSPAPFDILPAVWLASGLSVVTGILLCRVFARLWRKPWS